VDGVTHVLHLATSKETPETIIEVAVKGLFWLLEACRASPAFGQFILIGGTRDWASSTRTRSR
jgi:UDP-glucose 4-epimerase